MKAPDLLIFDVNETLLDLTPLKLKINKALKNESAFEIWFRTLLHYSLVETITGGYPDFSTIGKATFKMTAQQFEIEIADDEATSILSQIKNLPPHDDVIEGLKALKEQGFTLVALTNGNLPTAKEQLAFAKIDTFFSDIYSVDSVSKYKPHHETYELIYTIFNREPENTLMVAAHGWDVTGAMRAGLQTAFINRPGKFLYPLAEKPTFTAKNLVELAKNLAANN
ncbi:haloacid dehalogenase type II [Leeuwenhoekiella sp. A16]|uniref:haloacid dehalogenase type II n=1 Tax=unclassified Leeuwenhoekiella TaxID=2615029 RepID=UPI003A805480